MCCIFYEKLVKKTIKKVLKKKLNLLKKIVYYDIKYIERKDRKKYKWGKYKNAKK